MRNDGLINVEAAFVPPEIHARGSARGKLYRYVVEDGVPGEIDAAHAHAWRIGPIVDVPRMRAAAALLVGTHDFTSLRARSCTAKNPVKSISALSVARVARPEHEARDVVVIEVIGDGFLRKMVRNIVALLCEVGSGWRCAEDVPGILAARDRAAAGLCAPPGGLTLVRVGCVWPADGSGLIPLFETDAAVRAQRSVWTGS